MASETCPEIERVMVTLRGYMMMSGHISKRVVEQPEPVEIRVEVDPEWKAAPCRRCGEDCDCIPF